MPTENSTFEDIVQGIGNAILNVVEEIGNPIDEPLKTIYFLRKMGWNIPLNIDLSGKQFSFINNVKSLEIDSPADFIDLLANLNNVILDFDKIKNELGLDTSFSDFVNEFPRQFLDYTILSYFESEQPKLLSVFLFLGIADTSFINITSAARIPYKQNKIVWENLTTFLQSPDKIPELVYGWGTSDFKDKLLIEHIEYLLNSFEVQTGSQKIEHSKFKLSVDSIYAPFFDTEEISSGIQIYPIETDTTPQNAGLAISPFLFGSSDEEIVLSDFFKILISASLRVDKTTGLIIRPQTGFSLFDINDNSVIEGNLKITLRIGDEDGLVTIGAANSSRLEIKAVDVSAFAKLNTQSKEFGFEVGLKDSKIVIDLAGGDSFITSNVPLEPIEIPLDLTVGYSSIAGIYFKGSAGIEIKLPIHFQLGPVDISGVTVGVKVADRKIPITTSLDFKAELGPLSVVVEDVGAFVNLNFPDKNKGNTGPFDLDFGFKPPNGLGLSIDTGVVKGGGYLYFDFDREEYAGAVELVFSEWIALKAYGVITTKMPDGSKGFSMVVIITAEFGTGLQLGFGFTLIGVGGIVGINRVVNVEPLKVGVRTGAVESVLFPQNLVANAPRIISDLKAFFPVREGQFLIGPMAKIGYGTPTLASLSLGLIIEFPDVNITILGVLKIVLPDENADVLRLQVNFLGRIEPANNLLWFYAELYDSRVLFITLEGGMGLLVNWGDNANFVFSVGGFHPQYTPPPLPFPAPPRLAVNILNESYARVRIEGYFAVTSNSVQFGARVEVFFGLSAFNIDGHFGFDALFQFDPFYFSFSLSVSLSVKLFGMGLFSVGFSGLLEGPTPWHIKGQGSIGFLFFSVSVPFEETWGEQPATPLPPIEIFPLIKREFAAITNWQAVVPKGSSLHVSLRKLDEPPAPGPQTSQETDTRPLVLHPLGSLRISQRKMPLNFKMDKLGNQKPADVNEIHIEAVINGTSIVEPDFVKEKFARGEYQNLDQAKKLSSPGFEMYDGGVELKANGTQLQTSMAVKRIIRYETIIIDSNYKRFVHQFYGILSTQLSILRGRLFGHLIKGSIVSKSTLSATYKNRLQPNDRVIAVEPPKYSVANLMDNSPLLGSDGLAMASFTSKAEAVNFMQSQLASDPRKAGALHVIPNTELNKTAAA